MAQGPYLVHLLDVGDHDNDGCVLLPHHAPEIGHRADDGSLCGDVHLLLPTVALQPVKSSLSGQDQRWHSQEPISHLESPWGLYEPHWLGDKSAG